MDRVIDLTGYQKEPLNFEPPKHRISQGKVLRRRPDTIDGICIHQTACDFGVTPLQVKNAGGDPALAKHMRALGVAANVTAFKDGFAAVGNPLNWYVYNANQLNQRIISLEIEGSYPGTLTSNGPGHDRFDGHIVDAAKAGLEYLVTEGRRQGMPIKYLWAHRQSSSTRRNDPGQEIWQKLVVEYAVPVLGLITQLNYSIGDGRSIPKVWDPNAKDNF